MKAHENLSSWGNLSPIENALIYRPERAAAIKPILEEENKRTILALGNMRSYGDVCQNKNGAHIRMRRLNRVINFDKQTGIITAESGMTIAELTDFAISKKFLPPVVPGTGFCTLGGALGNDIHGKNHENSGTFSDHVLAFDLMSSCGEIKTITYDTHPDVFCATAGGLGLTGIILSVTIQLKRAESGTLKVKRQQKENLSALLEGLAMDEDDYSVAWIDALASGSSLGRGVLETAHSVGIEVPYDKAEPSSVPFMMPSFALNKYTVKLFNHLYYNRAEACNRETFEDFRQFSFPLDSILHWNRLYGKKGFYQFQCVLPENNAEEALRKILEKTSSSGSASFLAVLKKMGPQGKGLLSFPKAGYTLALDFPNRKNTISLLKELEHITLKADGRIYMAKDAMISPETFDTMYPNKQKFLDIVQNIDPSGRMASDAARRLNLVHKDNQ